MSLHLGRWLKHDEVVHHKDKDRTNNSLENLELTNASDHAKLHAMENGCVHYEHQCDFCGKLFDTTESEA